MDYNKEKLVEHNGKWYFEDQALAKAHDPRARDEDKFKAWMDKVGARESTARRCLGKVAFGRAHTCGHEYGLHVRDKPLCAVSIGKGYAWFDHWKMFWLLKEKEYVITAQPYNVTLGAVHEMEAFAKEHGLVVAVSIEDAWWYPGLTTLIVWRRATQH